MLVLSRKIGESIFLNDGGREVQLVVVEIRGGKVRLGIDAPKTTIISTERNSHKKDRHDART